MGYIPELPEIYQGNQVIINSDRLLFNAKTDSILLYSDKAIGFSTNGSIHFDTSKEKDGEEASNFIINSPNIYLGLTYNDRLPTNSAVLGDELEELLIDILTLIDDLIFDIMYKISYTSQNPGMPTVPFSGNSSMMRLRRNEIQSLIKSVKDIKTEKVKID